MSLGEKILWQRAKDYLAFHDQLVIGVSGSIGKTVAKEAIALALQKERSVYVPKRPYRSTLGVALGILGVDTLSAGWFSLLTRSLVRELEENEAGTVVLELDAYRPGDMAYLAEQLPVKIAVVTNIHTVHTSIFGSKDMVAHEVKSLVVSLPKDAINILNIDDPLVAEMAEHSKARVVTFGHDPKADVSISRLVRLPHKGFGCAITVGGRSYEFHQRHLVSRHQLSLVLSAIAVAYVLNLDVSEVISRLQEYVPPKGHLSVEKGINGATIINDTCEASPESMMAALETLRAIPARRRIAVLGDITDLGGEDFTVHKRIGKHAGEIAHIVIAVGERMRDAAAEAVFVGADVHHFKKAEDVGKWLIDFIRQDDMILVGGSEKMKMDEVIGRLIQ